MPPLSDRAFRRPPDGHSEAIPKAAGIARIRNAVLLARIEDIVAVRTQGAFDQLIGDVLEITLELIVKEIEFRPHHLLEEILPGAYHEGRPPLPRMAVGTYAVLAADRHEQPDRPHVGAERTETRFPGSRSSSDAPRRPLSRSSAASAAARSPSLPARRNSASTLPSFALSCSSSTIGYDFNRQARRRPRAAETLRPPLDPSPESVPTFFGGRTAYAFTRPYEHRATLLTYRFQPT